MAVCTSLRSWIMDARLAMKKNDLMRSIAARGVETPIREVDPVGALQFSMPCYWALRKEQPHLENIVMKKTRLLVLSALAVTTLGLSSCVVDEGYYDGGYAYVERPYVVQRPYYRDYSYGYGY